MVIAFFCEKKQLMRKNSDRGSDREKLSENLFVRDTRQCNRARGVPLHKEDSASTVVTVGLI